jgi:ribosomal protein S18 acetylase RimI-like enzyme
MAQGLKFVLRDAQPDDLAFCIDAWARESALAPWATGVPPQLFAQYQRRLIARVMQGAQTTVACSPVTPVHAYGFVSSGPDYRGHPVVHWVYVKGTFRDLGIGRALLEHAMHGRIGGWMSFASNRSIAHRAMSTLSRYSLTYNPFLFIPYSHAET